MPKNKYYWDGKYYQQKVRKSDNPADGYMTVRAKTIAEMDEKLSELNYQKKQGMILGKKVTVAEWIVCWWQNREYSFSASVKSYRKPMINNVIAPAIGHMQVSAVKMEDIQKIMASVATKSTSYNDKIYQLLKALFRDAKANGLTIINPTEGVKPGGEEGEEKPALTAEQFSTLIKAVTGTRAHLFCLLGYYTGLRKEEICGLTWADIHLDAPTPYLEVNHATTWPDRSKPKYPSPLKTDNSNRKIPLHKELIEPLREAKTASKSKFVIATKDGGALTFMSLRRLWGLVDDRTQPEFLPKSRIRDYRTDAGAAGKNKKRPNCEKTIDFYCTPHILRHTFATNMVASGMDIKKVQYLTGHADITVLLKIYAHFKQNQPEDLVDFINSAL